ncbi:MAG: DNA methyltransferase [Gemmatimonadetes bacterium]|nr:DNA methyltransferase [Gemmatimonadota bacterium]
MNSESVDLIATDPPFNKGKDFHATPDSLAAGAKFQDRWSWETDVHEEWVDQIKDDYPHVMNVIQGSRSSYGDDMGAFLCFMAVRLISMRRLLKPTGSIYLHCDPTASHYLKELMDAVFGKKNFRNEIVWCYTDPAGRRNTEYYKRPMISFSGTQKIIVSVPQTRLPKHRCPIRPFGDTESTLMRMDRSPTKD